MKFSLLSLIALMLLCLVGSTEVKAQCIGGFSQVTVLSTDEGTQTTFDNPNPPFNQISVFSGLINCTMDGDPFKVYCVDLFQTVNLPDNSYSETCQYAVSKVQYVLNNYYPLNSNYPGKLSDNNQEVAAIQLVLWSLYNNINIHSITDTLIKNRALAIRSDADINGMISEPIITFTINPAADPNAFYIKTIDENGDPIAVSDIVLSISIAGTLSEDTTSTDASGISPDIYVTGSLNGSVITATARMRYAQGRIIDGFISDRQTLAIALPVWGRMGVETEWGAEPVELSSFTSIIRANTVDLNWTTSSEINNSHFEVERLENENIVWKKIGSVAGNGNSTINHQYGYSDAGLLSGKYKYRLKQIDYNGNFEYFNLTTEINISTPEKYSLSQNFPNPFNPTTSIQFSIPVDGNINIQIFDMVGKEVMTLLNQQKPAGQYSVQVNGNNLSSGIYYYKITAGNFSAIKKMTLIK